MAGPTAAAQVKLALQYEREGKRREANDLLNVAARGGDPEAQYLLGVRMLAARNMQAPALKLIEMASARGHGDALRLAAVLATTDIAGPVNWKAALALLGKAARSDKRAAQQLDVIGSNFDVAAFVTSPAPEMRFASPRVGVIENFLPRAMCDWIIADAEPNLKPSMIMNASGPQAQTQSDTRTNLGAYINLFNSDLVVRLTQARIESALGLPGSHQEHPNVLRYEIGQQFADHYDFYEPEPFAAYLQTWGQRAATFLIYLNEDFDGGETGFPLLDWSYRGRTGDALFFWNTDASGQVERQLLHAGRPPTRGFKWLFSQWVRAKPVPLI